MSVQLAQRTAASVSTPPSGNIDAFMDSADGILKYKDASGNVHVVSGPGMSGLYDITLYGMSTGNTGTANVTALNALTAALPAGSTLYTPPGLFQLQGALNTWANVLIVQGVHGQSTWAWVNAGVTNTNLITLASGGYYGAIRDMIFQTFVTMTTNWVIECGNAVNLFIEGCLFVGGAATPFANCIDFTGTNSGNGAVVRGCYFSGWTGTGINVNSTLSSPFFSDIEMIGNGLAVGHSTTGIAAPNGGAILMTDCGIVACAQNVNLSPLVGNTVASVFAINCFFDQGVVNSLLISGAGTVLRCHFVGCWFTCAAAGSSANCVQTATTGSSIHGGLAFEACWIVNTPAGGGSPIGMNIAACQDIHITGCQIAGWTTGISVTPNASNNCALNIIGNLIGACGGVAANGTGIILGAGTYAYQNISVNTIIGNTTAQITDNTTVTTTANNNRSIKGNVGYNPKSVVAQPAVPATTVAVFNSTGVDCIVYVKGGTLTVITVGGVATGIAAAAAASTAFPIMVAANQSIAITFSVAPTWVWVGT